MITAVQLQKMLQDGMPASQLREELAGGVQQRTKEERISMRNKLLNSMSHEFDVFQAVLEVACNEVIVLKHGRSFLYHTLANGIAEVVTIAVVERMKTEGLREESVSTLRRLCDRKNLQQEVGEAVMSLMDPSVFGWTRQLVSHTDPLSMAIGCKNIMRDYVISAVLRHGPPIEERATAVYDRFCYVKTAAGCADMKILQQMHDLVPLLPDGSGRRGELADYAKAIRVAATCRSAGVLTMMEYLSETAGRKEVFDFCDPSILLKCCSCTALEWLVDRAPQLVEAVCKDFDCLLLIRTNPNHLEFLVERMAEIVEPNVLCGMTRRLETPPPLWYSRGLNWRSKLKPVHDAVPESMDGLRWKGLMGAISDKTYRDVEYMLGLCTRVHLAMRNTDNDTAYDLAERDKSFPPELLLQLTVRRHDSVAL